MPTKRCINPIRHHVRPGDLNRPAASFAGVLFATDGGTLPGSQVSHQFSMRYGTHEEAQQWLTDTLYSSRKLRIECDGYVQPLDDYPQVFRHCKKAKLAGVGTECPGCKQFITVQDAWAYAKAREPRIVVIAAKQGASNVAAQKTKAEKALAKKRRRPLLYWRRLGGSNRVA